MTKKIKSGRIGTYEGHKEHQGPECKKIQMEMGMGVQSNWILGKMGSYA